MSAVDDESALALAIRFAQEAGKELLARQGRIDPRSVHTKSSRRDLVSEADLAADKLLTARLTEAFPGEAIHAEESSRAPEGAPAVWYVDPLDGTTNFVHGLAEFTVSIARFVAGAPRVAVVHAPRLGETFTARAGGGAFRNGAPVRVSATADLADALVATGFPYRRAELANNNLENFGRLFLEVRDLRRLGSAALDLAYVACGRFDAYWELHLERHDVAAGGLLVSEAGGRITAIGGGPEWTTGRSVLATNGPLHDAMLSLLRA